MTAQISENLIYEGKTHSLCSAPLKVYFTLMGDQPDFESNCTALWRGYVGSWEIIDDRLYLTGLVGRLTDGTEVSVSTVFPNYPDRVFAHWYSGKVRIPQGKLLKYVHMGYSSKYERDLFLTFEKGVVISSQVVVNGESPNENAPEGYGIGGMTVFPSAHDAESKS